MEEYHKFICINCGKEHDGTYASGRFCSLHCAHSFATKNDNSKETKKAKCSNCGNIIFVNKRDSLKTCLCKSCKLEHHKPSDVRICKICGRHYYKSDGGCKNEFCKNTNLLQFKTLIKYFGFNKEKLGTLDVEIEYNRIKEDFIYLYNVKNFSLWEIGEFYNYKFPNNLSKIFNYLNIKKRSRKETSKNAILRGRLLPGSSFKFKTEYHTTWNNKEVYLRSSYESDYAKELDEQQIDYEVEFLRIKYFDTQKNEYRCAIPDFYLPDENLIVEIKSNWTLNVQEMKDRFKAYIELGYNCKLICEHKELDLNNL